VFLFLTFFVILVITWFVSIFHSSPLRPMLILGVLPFRAPPLPLGLRSILIHAMALFLLSCSFSFCAVMTAPLRYLCRGG
jgi:hypothetical protein